MLSPRYFNRGDFVTFEGPALKTDNKPNDWGEWCTTWGEGWDHNAGGNFSNGFILGNFAKARALDINMNLGIGPDKDGELNPKHLHDMAVVAELWKDTWSSPFRAATPRKPWGCKSVLKRAMTSSRGRRSSRSAPPPKTPVPA